MQFRAVARNFRWKGEFDKLKNQHDLAADGKNLDSYSSS